MEFLFKAITDDLTKNEKELSDVEDDILNLSGGLEEASLNADVVRLRNRLSRMRTLARESADQLQTMQSLWNQLERYEQWNEAKTAQLRGYESIYYDRLPTVVSELQVTWLYATLLNLENAVVAFAKPFVAQLPISIFAINFNEASVPAPIKAIILPHECNGTFRLQHSRHYPYNILCSGWEF
jgi:hypothetical protein